MLLMVLSAASALVCPVERAHYVLRHHPAVTAVFRPVAASEIWPSGVALEVRSNRSPALSWWVPWLGGTDNLRHLASTTDIRVKGWRPPDPDDGPRPYGDRDYLGANARYDLLPGKPMRGQPAPAHILIPNAGSSHDQVFEWRDWFDFTGCARAPR